MAEPRRLDLDANMAGLQGGGRHLLDAQRRVELVDDGGPVGSDRLTGRLGFGGGDSHPSPSAEVVSSHLRPAPRRPTSGGTRSRMRETHDAAPGPTGSYRGRSRPTTDDHGTGWT